MEMIRWAILGIAIMLTAGCAGVNPPSQTLAERLDYGAAERARFEQRMNWWEIYGDVQLDRLMDLALERNADLAKAAINVNRALYQARLLGADLVPAFSGGFNASADKSLKGGPSSTSVGGNLSLSYELDLWQRLADTVSAAQWEHRATIEDMAATRLALIGGVADGYYQLAYLDGAIKAMRAAIANYRRILDTVLAKHQFGRASSLEEAQARQSLLSAENSLIDLNNQRQSADEAFRNFLNAQPGENLGFTTVDILKFKAPSVDMNVPISVLANRPDLKSAEFRLLSAFKDAQAMEKSWFPSVSIGASLSSSGRNAGTAFNLPFTGGNVSIDLPFLNWEKVRWNVKISEADYETARLNFEQTLTTSLNEVATAYVAYDNARANLMNVERKYAEDLKIAGYYQTRYESGSNELSDWLGALNTLDSSRQALLSARYGLIQTVNYLYRALGGRYADRIS